MKYVSKLDFYEYIRCVLSISINQWERIPGKEYDIDKMHQIAIEKYRARYKDMVTLILSYDGSDFVMEVEFDDEKGVFYEVPMPENHKEEIKSNYDFLLDGIRNNQEKKLDKKLVDIFNI